MNEEFGWFNYYCWGLILYWVKDSSNVFKLINVCMEGIGVKFFFWVFVCKWCCLVIVDSFYEWCIEGK